MAAYSLCGDEYVHCDGECLRIVLRSLPATLPVCIAHTAEIIFVVAYKWYNIIHLFSRVTAAPSAYS